MAAWRRSVCWGWETAKTFNSRRTNTGTSHWNRSVNCIGGSVETTGQPLQPRGTRGWHWPIWLEPQHRGGETGNVHCFLYSKKASTSWVGDQVHLAKTGD